jgi:hypothetical protein
MLLDEVGPAKGSVGEEGRRPQAIVIAQRNVQPAGAAPDVQLALRAWTRKQY